MTGIFESGAVEFDRSIAEVPLGFFQDTFFMEGAGHQVVINTPELSTVDVLAPNVADLLPADQDLAVYDWNALQPGLRQAIQADMSFRVFSCTQSWSFSWPSACSTRS